MNFGYDEKVETLRAKLQTFMTDYIYPNERVWHAHTASEQRWQPVPIIEELKLKAQAAGLWNLWLPKSFGGALSNTECALMRGHGAGALGAGSIQLLRS